MAVPVLVGVGTVAQRVEDPLRAHEPLALMTAAAGRAGADSGRQELLAQVDRVYVPQGRWRYRDAAGGVAAAIGASGATTVHAKVGVLQQTLIGDACHRIGTREISVALIVGGDAGHRLSRAAVAGVELHDTELTGRSDVLMKPAQEMMLEVEVRSGLGTAAAGYYAIIESAFRAGQGLDVDAHRDALASMYERFSVVAAENPDAWDRNVHSLASIRDPSPENRMIAFPYTRRHCSSWSVDQASALLLCSSALAEALGIPRSKWVFPLVSTESNHMTSVSARADLGRCPGAQIAGSAALAHAELDVASIDLLELYSCFPVAVEMYAKELGISLARDLTVTGGMPFAGGPFNNFVLQSTCRLARLLRATPGRGLVSSVSGVLTKQGFGLWATDPGVPFAHIDVTSKVARASGEKPVVGHFAGVGTIAGYTVLHDRDPHRAVAVVDTEAGARTVATTEDPTIVGILEEVEGCGRRVLVVGDSFSLM